MAQDMSYMYPTFPIVATIILLLCLYPVPLQWRAGNIATTAMAMWTSIGLLISIIDVCVWHGNIRNPYPIWGDFVALYFIMVSTGIAGCALCVQYRLWAIVRAKTVFITKNQKGRQRWVTCFLCFGIPAIEGILHYVVQDSRYQLFEDLGPMSETAPVQLALLYYLWDPALCLIASIFSAMTIRLLMKRRKLFEEVVNSGSTTLNKDHYRRLMGLAAFTIFVHLPISLWVLIVFAIEYNYPVTDWKDIHSDFGTIEYIDRFLISVTPHAIISLSVAWWSLPLAGLSFFILFGSKSASEPYQPIIAACLKPFGIKYPQEEKRGAPKRSWLDIILRRPGRSSSPSETIIPKFTTDTTDTTQGSSSGTIDSIVDIRPTTFSFGDDTRHMQKKASQESPLPSSQRNIDGDMEQQQSPDEAIAQERRRIILERNPELTEEVTF